MLTIVWIYLICRMPPSAKKFWSLQGIWLIESLIKEKEKEKKKKKKMKKNEEDEEEDDKDYRIIIQNFE